MTKIFILLFIGAVLGYLYFSLVLPAFLRKANGMTTRKGLHFTSISIAAVIAVCIVSQLMGVSFVVMLFGLLVGMMIDHCIVSKVKTPKTETAAA